MRTGFLSGFICLLSVGIFQYCGLLFLAAGNLTQDVSYLIPIAIWSSLPQFLVGFVSGCFAKRLNQNLFAVVIVSVISLVIAGISALFVVSEFTNPEFSGRPIQRYLEMRAVIVSLAGSLLSLGVLYILSRIKKLMTITHLK